MHERGVDEHLGEDVPQRARAQPRREQAEARGEVGAVDVEGLVEVEAVVVVVVALCALAQSVEAGVVADVDGGEDVGTQARVLVDDAQPIGQRRAGDAIEAQAVIRAVVDEREAVGEVVQAQPLPRCLRTSVFVPTRRPSPLKMNISAVSLSPKTLPDERT